MGSGGPDLPARVENGFGFYLEGSQFPGGKETICLRNLYGLGNSLLILALTEYSMIKKVLPYPNSHLQTTGHVASSSVLKQEFRGEWTSEWVLVFRLKHLDSRGSVQVTHGYAVVTFFWPSLHLRVICQPIVELHVPMAVFHLSPPVIVRKILLALVQ